MAHLIYFNRIFIIPVTVFNWSFLMITFLSNCLVPNCKIKKLYLIIHSLDKLQSIYAEGKCNNFAF